MNNPIIVPMTVSASDTNVPMTLSSDDRTFGMGMDSAVFIAPVKGVKGDAETDYRTGYVNLTADDIGVDTSEFALRSELPTATSDLTNDSGFIDGSQVPSNETDPTVPSWAKQPTKPSYTASEVHALPDTTVIPSSTSQLVNDSGFITSASVPTATSDLVNDSGFIVGADVPSNETDPTVPAWAKASTKPTYTASEVHALPDTTVIPSATSQLVNDSGFIVGADVPSNETDPTVPSWAKASSKPSYTASEVGALPDTTVIPSATSQLNNDSGYITSSALPTNVSDLNNDVPYAVANSDGAALNTMAIPMGAVDSTSTATVFTATVQGITELKTGVCMMLSNHVVTSASGFTININGLGAKPVYSNMTNATRDTTIFNVAYTMLFVYDESLNSADGGWWCYRGYNSDTNTIGYQIRTNSMSLPMSDKVYRYRILFTNMNGDEFIPSNTSTSTNATASRSVIQTPIDPFGRIVYYGGTSAVSAGSRPAATALWEQYAITLGYSFNRTGAALNLTLWKPVWLKCAPQSDGSAIIDDTTPYVQDLPTTEDGKIYIFLGVAYSATQVEMTLQHPIKYYKDGAIRNWFG